MADMITRCPKCGTAFRISEALLKSAKGAVRCGSCLSVFNARDYLEFKPAKPVAPSTTKSPTTASNSMGANTHSAQPTHRAAPEITRPIAHDHTPNTSSITHTQRVIKDDRSEQVSKMHPSAAESPQFTTPSQQSASSNSTSFVSGHETEQPTDHIHTSTGINHADDNLVAEEIAADNARFSSNTSTGFFEHATSETLVTPETKEVHDESEDDEDESWALELLKDDSDLNVQFKKVAEAESTTTAGSGIPHSDTTAAQILQEMEDAFAAHDADLDSHEEDFLHEGNLPYDSSASHERSETHDHPHSNGKRPSNNNHQFNDNHQLNDNHQFNDNRQPSDNRQLNESRLPNDVSPSTDLALDVDDKADSNDDALYDASTAEDDEKLFTDGPDDHRLVDYSNSAYDPNLYGDDATSAKSYTSTPSSFSTPSSNEFEAAEAEDELGGNDDHHEFVQNLAKYDRSQSATHDDSIEFSPEFLSAPSKQAPTTAQSITNTPEHEESLSHNALMGASEEGNTDLDSDAHENKLDDEDKLDNEAPAVATATRKPIRPKVEPKSTSLKEVIASLEPEPLEVDWEEPGAWRKRLLWPVLVLVALLGLLVQVAWLEFDRLSRIEPYRSLYGTACNIVGCTLPELIDRSQIQTSNLLVRSHPTVANALQVDVILLNNAGFEQTFPSLELTFTNLQNEPVAQRRLKPHEYLGGELSGRKTMPVRQPIHIALEIADPGPSAVSYHINIVD